MSEARQPFKHQFAVRKKMEKRIEELDPWKNCGLDRIEQHGDTIIAEIFSEVTRNQAKFNMDNGCWYVWNEKRYEKDSAKGAIIDGLMQDFVTALVMYSRTVMPKDPSDSYEIKKIDAMQKFVGKYLNRKNYRQIIEAARSANCIKNSDLDADPWLLNCKNGVLDLREKELYPHDPKRLITKMSNFVYDPDKSSEVWEKFIREIMEDDNERIDYLQRLLGYSLQGRNTQEEAYLIYGRTTRNGKGTLMYATCTGFGDYAIKTSPETFAAVHGKDSSKPSPDIARLDGARLVSMSEPDRGMAWNVALLKKYLGRDTLVGRFLSENPVEFRPEGRLLIDTNHLPRVNDDTLFSSDRIWVIPFNRHFREEERDVQLKNKLIANDILSGMLNWMLVGLDKYIADGERLNRPQSVIDATEEYRNRDDKVGTFFAERLQTFPGYRVQGKDVYAAYSVWCASNGYRCENKTNFFDALKTRGLLVDSATIEGHTKRNVVMNYVLLDEGPEEEQQEIPF